MGLHREAGSALGGGEGIWAGLAGELGDGRKEAARAHFLPSIQSLSPGAWGPVCRPRLLALVWGREIEGIELQNGQEERVREAAERPLVLKVDSPTGSLAVSLKQQIDPCVGLRRKLVRNEPFWRRRGRGEPAGRVLSQGLQSWERLQGGCRGAARGPGGVGVSSAGPPQRARCTWLYRRKGQASSRAGEGAGPRPQGLTLGLALLQEGGFPCGLLEGARSGAHVPTLSDFWTWVFAAISVSLLFPRKAVVSEGIIVVAFGCSAGWLFTWFAQDLQRPKPLGKPGVLVRRTADQMMVTEGSALKWVLPSRCPWGARWSHFPGPGE